MMFLTNPHKKKSSEVGASLHVISVQEMFVLKKHTLYSGCVGERHFVEVLVCEGLFDQQQNSQSCPDTHFWSVTSWRKK
jgi:hypothetical protein